MAGITSREPSTTFSNHWILTQEVLKIAVSIFFMGVDSMSHRNILWPIYIAQYSVCMHVWVYRLNTDTVVYYMTDKRLSGLLWLCIYILHAIT